MFSENIISILNDFRNNNTTNIIKDNIELQNLFIDGTENDRKLACLIILSIDNRELNIYRDKNMVINMFNPLMKDLLLQSDNHKELGEKIISTYTNFNFVK